MERSVGTPLTRLVARGAIINAAAALIAGVLFATRNLIAAAFMGPSVLAVWAVAGVVLVTAISLRGVGVVEAFVADRERPAREAFNDAFAVGLLFSALVAALVAASAPLLALVYDDPRLLVPLVAVAVLVLTDGLKFPIWWHYRELRYGRQRALMLTDAIGSVLFALPLLALGWDYWALIAGAALASVVTIALAWGMGPRPHLRAPTRGTIRRYAAFGGPVLGFAVTGIIVTHLGYAALRHVSGLEALGWIAVATIPFLAAERVTTVLNQSVYPALVRRGEAPRERAVEVMQRIGWAATAPLALGIAFTAPWLIPLGLGPEWSTAGALMSVIAVAAVVRLFGFPFAVIVMSSGETRAITRYAVVFTAASLLVVIPATLIWGLVGLSVGILVSELLCAIERWRIMREKLPGADLFRNLADDLMVALLPGLGAGAALLATQGFPWSQRLGLALVLGTLGLVVVAIRHAPLVRTVIVALRGPARSTARAAPGTPLPAQAVDEVTVA